MKNWNKFFSSNSSFLLVNTSTHQCTICTDVNKSDASSSERRKTTRKCHPIIKIIPHTKTYFNFLLRTRKGKDFEGIPPTDSQAVQQIVFGWKHWTRFDRDHRKFFFYFASTAWTSLLNKLKIMLTVNSDFRYFSVVLRRRSPQVSCIVRLPWNVQMLRILRKQQGDLRSL